MVVASTLACAGNGLAAPAVETLWPQWQARITVLTANASPLSATSLYDRSAPPRGMQGGGVFGDYVFAAPAFGRFRASGGVVSGNLSGLPLASAAFGTRLGVSVVGQTAPGYLSTADAPGAMPYLGLGFTSGPLLGSLALTAELGVVAERPGAAGGLGRAVFGNQSLDRSLRELGLGPVLQLGVRYSF
jgi:hypothetical protein